MIFWGYAGAAESMQVHQTEVQRSAINLVQHEKQPGRLLLPAPRSSFSPPADFSDFNNVREQFKWKFILESRILIKKLHLIYFKSKICMGVTKDSWSWTKSWGVAFTSVHFCSQLVPSPFNFIHAAHGLTQIYFSNIRSHANILNLFSNCHIHSIMLHNHISNCHCTQFNRKVCIKLDRVNCADSAFIICRTDEELMKN